MKISKCRSCDSDRLDAVLDLGSTPLANALAAERCGPPDPVYPLELVACRNCGLAQITYTVAPDELFSEYLYFSSFSDTMLAHSRELADALISAHRLNKESLVVEIASNDGYLLKNFVASGIPVLGIEPARNIASAAIEAGVPTLSEFFGLQIAKSVVQANGQADLILANNVMAHVPDINGVVAGIRELLKPSGTFVMETPYLGDLLHNLEFDTIYHEHLFYYSVSSLQPLFEKHDLEVVDVERTPIHGGSLRLFVCHAGAQPQSERVAQLLSEERSAGITDKGRLDKFARDVRALRVELQSMLAALKSGGQRIAGYGASAKGSTLLNFCGLGNETLDYLVDRSTVKQGRFSPGGRIPILSPSALTERSPDYVLLLTWNFAAEILEQQSEFREQGGKFVIPVPTPLIV